MEHGARVWKVKCRYMYFNKSLYIYFYLINFTQPEIGLSASVRWSFGSTLWPKRHNMVLQVQYIIRLLKYNMYNLNKKKRNVDTIHETST